MGNHIQFWIDPRGFVWKTACNGSRMRSERTRYRYHQPCPYSHRELSVRVNYVIFTNADRFTALRNNAQLRDVYILLGTMRLESRNSGTSCIEAAPQPATENEDPSEQALIESPQPVHVGQGMELDPDTVTGTENHASLPDIVLANTASAESEHQPYITAFEIARNSCGSHCNCTCHRTFRYRIPGLLGAVFGTLLLGYQAPPWFSQGCRNGRCRRFSTRLHYMFPKWFVKRSIALTIACSQPKGPELILRVLRPRPTGSFIFICAQSGYYDELKCLLNNGEASVVDIDEQNQTALTVRLNLPVISEP